MAQARLSLCCSLRLRAPSNLRTFGEVVELGTETKLVVEIKTRMLHAASTIGDAKIAVTGGYDASSQSPSS
jgi:hypothetical protein